MAEGNDAAPGTKIAPETIAVRGEEDFDHGKVADYLRDKLPGADRPLEVAQFPGGHANLTYLLRYPDVEYVLRRPPLGPVAATAHDMGREYQALSVLYQAYPPAPRAFLYCGDEQIVGAPFFVMERRRGIVVRQSVPAEFGGGEDAVANRRISEAMIDALADLHRVDPSAIGLGNLGKPEGFMKRQIDGWMNRYRRAETEPKPLPAELHAWLLEHLPASPPPALLHNDWRLDNIMLDAADPGRVEAVFDWDMCTLGDPLADLGTLLSSWVEANEGPGVSGVGSMPSNTPGFLTRREAVERYGRRRGVDVSVVPYYYAFGLFKMAVVVQQIYQRYHLGQTKDERFAIFASMADALFGLAKERSENPRV